ELLALGADDVAIGIPAEGEFDVILESIGGDSLAAAIAVLAPEGTIVTFGNSSGEKTALDSSSLYRRNGARLVGFTLFPALVRIGGLSRDLGPLAVEAAEGRLDPGIDLVRPWAAAAEAVEALLDRRVAGKAVLLVE